MAPQRVEEVSRLAPSPTGALHLGNARTFLVNWALAKRGGWRLLMRVEDLDGPRIKAEAAEQALDTLRWLGLDWDGEPSYQTHDPAPYADALTRLAEQGAIYPCRCTRSEIEAASLSAPHAGEHELRYPGKCRPASPRPVDWRDESFAGAAWRFRVPDEAIAFDDRSCGRCVFNVQQTVGDFVVATKAGLPSYQLAVVVDDARQGVTHVVRGDDLLSSTPRQMLLGQALGIEPPGYTHLPIVVGEDGRRLAKRHGDTRVDSYRAEGVSPERVVGLIAEWCGLGMRRELSAAEFAAGFELERLPREAVTFTAADDRWLRGSDG